ncbi:MAG: hypothetical protein ABFD75_12335 [Smithella sp.]
MTISLQQHIDTILSTPVFSGELYYIQKPDSSGSAAQVALTYGVYTLVGGETFESLEGDTGTERSRVQVSIYAIDSSDLVAKVAAVKAAMLAAAILAQTSDQSTTAAALLNYQASGQVDGYEDDTGRFYSHMDYYCGLS